VTNRKTIPVPFIPFLRSERAILSISGRKIILDRDLAALMIITTAFSAWLLLASSVFGAVLEVESASTRLRIDSDSGRLVSVTDKPTGREFLFESDVPLYELSFAAPELRLTSRDAERVKVQRLPDGLRIETTRHKQASITVTCTFRTQPGSPFIVGRIAVQCDPPRLISWVRFPILRVALPLGDAQADDAVLLPQCDGSVVRNPLKNGLHRLLPYPGAASMQLMAVFGKQAGIYLASHDAKAFTKTLTARRAGRGVELNVAHLLSRTPQRRWELPYDMALATFRGAFGADSTTWEDAANLYRTWAVKQPWCRRTLAARVKAGDVPKWLTEPSLFYSFSLRGQNRDKRMVNRLPDVVGQAEAWREVLGGPVTFMLMAWEKRGPWVTPDYFPPFGGAEAFKRVTGELHARGNRTLVFLSGLKWTLHKKRDGAVIDQQAAFDRRGRPSAISDPGGKPLIYGKPTDGVGRYAQICAATPLAREILLGSAMRCQDLGIDCVQVDQIVGGGLPLCYHPEHPHPPGGGDWCAKSLYALFAEIRRKGKAADPDFAFAIEEPAEFFIPVLDTYHAREYKQASWPRTGRGVMGVPLFAHVYHDYMLGYGGDGCQVSDKPWPVALYQQAANLACGKTPGAAVWTRWFDPRSTHEFQRRLLRAHFDLWRGPAREFLVFGQRVASPALNVPSHEVSFYDWRKRTRTVLEFPSVLHSAWRLPDGRIGHVFVCIVPRPVSFTALGRSFTLRPGEAAFEIQE